MAAHGAMASDHDVCHRHRAIDAVISLVLLGAENRRIELAEHVIAQELATWKLPWLPRPERATIWVNSEHGEVAEKVVENLPLSATFWPSSGARKQPKKLPPCFQKDPRGRRSLTAVLGDCTI